MTGITGIHRLALAAGGALLMAASAVGVVYFRSESRLREVPATLPFSVALPADSASMARGEHLARTRGCFSCHGAELEGHDFSDEWSDAGSPVAPNLARLARTEEPAALERAIRHGVGRDGRALWSMPSYNFRRLRDEDVAALIGFLRTQPVVEHALPRARHSWAVRWDLAFRGGTHMPEWVAQVPALRTAEPGEYLAMTACNECHGLDLRGSSEGTPDLAIVAGYTRTEFGRLLREGVSRDGRAELRLMSGTARNRYAHLRDDEVDALYTFLRSLAGQPVPSDVFWRELP